MIPSSGAEEDREDEHAFTPATPALSSSTAIVVVTFPVMTIFDRAGALADQFGRRPIINADEPANLAIAATQTTRDVCFRPEQPRFLYSVRGNEIIAVRLSEGDLQ
ncbi:MAG: hypothetical protein QM684_21945 [Rhizobium sp.]